MSKRPFSQFPTTRWQLLSSTSSADTVLRQRAVADLAALYFGPVHAYVSSVQALPRSDVDDVVQGFFQTRWLEQNFPSRAQAGRGRFRNYLLTAVANFVRDRLAHLRSERKHQSDSVEAIVQFELAADRSDGPSQAFDRAWAESVIATAVEQMGEMCRAENREALWGVFEARVVNPALHHEEPVEYGALVERWGFESPTEASNALVTAKRMFARTLRTVVVEFEGEDAPVDETVRELYRVLERGTG